MVALRYHLLIIVHPTNHLAIWLICILYGHVFLLPNNQLTTYEYGTIISQRPISYVFHFLIYSK